MHVRALPRLMVRHKRDCFHVVFVRHRAHCGSNFLTIDEFVGMLDRETSVCTLPLISIRLMHVEVIMHRDFNTPAVIRVLN